MFNNASRPQYNTGVLIGNWVEDRIECPKQGTFYFPPVEKLDYEKLKPESRKPDFGLNKLTGLKGNVKTVITHDSHFERNNFVTTSDLVYNHLPKPLCGPDLRHYRQAAHQFYPQPDLARLYDHVTEWGLKKYKEHEWKCTDVSDYSFSLYDDSYVPPKRSQYLPRDERRARDASFTKSFRFKFTKSK